MLTHFSIKNNLKRGRTVTNYNTVMEVEFYILYKDKPVTITQVLIITVYQQATNILK